MASFETHLNITTLATGIITIPLLSSGLVNTQESILLLFFGVIGGILPDLDSDNSIPIQIAFKILSLIFPLLFIFNYADGLPLFHIAGLWLITSTFVHLIFTYGFLPLTSHRGIFHTLAMGIVFGELTALFMINMLDINTNISIFSGIYITFGFMTHLILDEMFSVNLLGVSLKRSFGSAFKVYTSGNIFGSIIVNALAIGLFFLLPNVLEVFQNLANLLSQMKFI